MTQWEDSHAWSFLVPQDKVPRPTLSPQAHTEPSGPHGAGSDGWKRSAPACSPMSPTSLFLWLTAALRHSRLLGLLGQIDALQFSAARVSSLPFTYQYFLSWTQTLQSLWSRLSKDSRVYWSCWYTAEVTSSSGIGGSTSMIRTEGSPPVDSKSKTKSGVSQQQAKRNL